MNYPKFKVGQKVVIKSPLCKELYYTTIYAIRPTKEGFDYILSFKVNVFNEFREKEIRKLTKKELEMYFL